MKRRRNADERRRRIERSGDPAEILLDRVRRGEVTQAQVDFAARLDDPAALALMTEPVKPIGWTRRSADVDRLAAIDHVGDLLHDREGLAAAFAVDCAERALPVFERHSSDARPRQAIEAARGWLATRSAAARRVARVAAHDAAACARAIAFPYAARPGAWAASHAALAAGTPAYAPWGARSFTVGAAINASEAAVDDIAELAWQQQRLADYVLGRVQIPRPAQQNPPPRRRNADERRRRIERSAAGGDAEAQVRALLERVRSGEVTQEQVDLAARLDDPAALALMTESSPGRPVDALEWVSDVIYVIRRAGDLLRDPRGLAVAFAADCAERVLPLFKRTRPKDVRPAQAIAAARKWLVTRSAGDDVRTRFDAAAGAVAAAGAPPAREAAGAAYCAYVAAYYDDDDDAVALAEAAADNAAVAVYRGAYRDAYRSTARANFVAEDARDAERAWQKQRLADYVLGRVQIPRPARGSP